MSATSTPSDDEFNPEYDTPIEEKTSPKRQRTATKTVAVRKEKDDSDDTMVRIYFNVVTQKAINSYILEVVTTEGHLKKIDQLLEALTKAGRVSGNIVYLLQEDYDLSDWKSMTFDQFRKSRIKRDDLEFMEKTLGAEVFKYNFIDTKPISSIQKSSGYRPSARNSTSRMIFDF
jgi:hypothetical protein